MSDTTYLLICIDCAGGEDSKLLPMPFGSAAERRKWAALHSKGTGHHRWSVIDLVDGDLP